MLKIYSPGIGRKKSMKLKMKKLVRLGLVSAMSITMQAAETVMGQQMTQALQKIRSQKLQEM